MKKIRIREGLTWNTLIFDYRKKRVSVRYFQVTTKNFTFLPLSKTNIAGQNIPVVSWLIFRWGQMPVGRLRANENGSIRDDRTGRKYQLSLQRTFRLIVQNSRLY